MSDTIYYCPTCEHIENTSSDSIFYKCFKCGCVSIKVFKDKIGVISAPLYEDVTDKYSLYNIAKNLKDIKYSQIYENPRSSLIELIINGCFEELKALSSICDMMDIFTARTLCECALIYSLRYINFTSEEEETSFLIDKMYSVSPYRVGVIVKYSDFNNPGIFKLLGIYIDTFRLYFFFIAFINRGCPIESVLNSRELKIYEYYKSSDICENSIGEMNPVVYLCKTFDINIRMGVEKWL